MVWCYGSDVVPRLLVFIQTWQTHLIVFTVTWMLCCFEFVTVYSDVEPDTGGDLFEMNTQTCPGHDYRFISNNKLQITGQEALLYSWKRECFSHSTRRGFETQGFCICTSPSLPPCLLLVGFALVTS